VRDARRTVGRNSTVLSLATALTSPTVAHTSSHRSTAHSHESEFCFFFSLLPADCITSSRRRWESALPRAILPLTVCAAPRRAHAYSAREHDLHAQGELVAVCGADADLLAGKSSRCPPRSNARPPWVRTTRSASCQGSAFVCKDAIKFVSMVFPLIRPLLEHGKAPSCARRSSAGPSARHTARGCNPCPAIGAASRPCSTRICGTRRSATHFAIASALSSRAMWSSNLTHSSSHSVLSSSSFTHALAQRHGVCDRSGRPERPFSLTDVRG
jgi:hypothetical protein